MQETHTLVKTGRHTHTHTHTHTNTQTQEHTQTHRNTRTYVQAYNVGMETYLFQSAVGDLAVLCGRACELTRVSCNLNDEREEELALGDVEVNVLL